MCQPNCRHIEDCAHNASGYNCDLNNDSFHSLCSPCREYSIKKQMKFRKSDVPIRNNVDISQMVGTIK